MNEQAQQQYRKRFEQVFAHIDRHLDADLSVDGLCAVAHFSRFHFQRQFSAYAGISVTRYVQLLRLRRASYQLAFAERQPVVDIALAAGFASPESFARAFKRTFGQTPSEFRTRPAWQPWNERMQLPQRQRSIPMQVSIVDFAETLVAVKEHCGPKQRILETVGVFIDWRKRSGLSPVTACRTFGIPYSDPDTTPPAHFRFDVCGEINAPVPDNPQGVVTKRIPGGRCAKLRHIGSTDLIGDSVWQLYRDWLPDSGEELRDFPVFFHYIERVPQVPEHEQVTDIYLPLQ